MVLLEILGFFLAPFLNLLEPFVQQIYGVLTSRTLRRKAVQGFISLLVLFLLVGVSLAAYLGFYWMYIPQRGHMSQVYLQYGPRVAPGMIGSKPAALVDFSRGGRVDQVLRGDQAYDISVHLVVPTSRHNVALGNFMVTVSLLDKYDRPLTSSSRPALLTYESLPVRWMRTLWRAIPLVLLWSKESQTLQIPVLDRFIENSAHPVHQALLEISTGELQIYKCSLHIDAHFQGLRYFMYYYRVSTAIVFMSLFIFWEIVFTILTWQLLKSWFGPAKGNHALTVQDPQLAQTTTRLYEPLNDNDDDDDVDDDGRGGRSLSFRGTGASRPRITSFTSGRRQGQIPALGPIPRQPQLQEDAYFASESEGSEESLEGSDEEDEEEQEQEQEQGEVVVVEEDEEGGGVGHRPHSPRKTESIIATESLGGRPGSASARPGPDLEESDELDDAVVPVREQTSGGISRIGSATAQDADSGEGLL